MEHKTYPQLLTVAQAAHVLNGAPYSTITEACRTGRIFAVKIGKQWRINTRRLAKQYGLTLEIEE
ncbi:helix-turn-helix domain-containing protein [Atopobium fossor]|uniref:helix-turn-helix domain-containing protein n=1 Tax=Atopobium fossor TaxID=39487 RepID=UPI0004893A69|nr:helix-turn-helix domain-containing protein [Atopobium fossor]